MRGLSQQKGVLSFNPRSCGPQRFELPVTVGLLTIGMDGKMEAKIVELVSPLCA